MTIFLAYALVGSNANALKPKKNTNKKQTRKGKDKPATLDPSVYPTLFFLSDVCPETIISRVMHEFCCGGKFYFQKKPLQCGGTVAPFIIYYLYTFDDITTLWAESALLLEGEHQGMQYDLTLPEEFEHAKIPEINIPRGVPKLPGQPGNHFHNYSREMLEACHAHLIECNLKAIPFLHVLIGYIKEFKLDTPIWGRHVHITKMVNWDSPKGHITRFFRMLQDHTCYIVSVTSVEVWVSILKHQLRFYVLSPETH
jgi:hypothetical protein